MATVVGSGIGIVRKVILSEGSNMAIPAGSTILYSEVVVDSDGDELLEVWLLVPSTAPGTNPSGGSVVYTNTVIDDDDDYIDEAQFANEIEESVNRRMQGMEDEFYD